MRWKFRELVAWLAAAMVAVATVRAAADDARRGADYFSNLTLTTQDGVEVRVYDDLLKGKIVAINLIYTTCKYACPLETARLTQVAKLLGDRIGRDIGGLVRRRRPCRDPGKSLERSRRLSPAGRFPVKRRVSPSKSPTPSPFASIKVSRSRL